MLTKEPQSAGEEAQPHPTTSTTHPCPLCSKAWSQHLPPQHPQKGAIRRTTIHTPTQVINDGQIYNRILTHNLIPQVGFAFTTTILSCQARGQKDQISSPQQGGWSMNKLQYLELMRGPKPNNSERNQCGSRVWIENT